MKLTKRWQRRKQKKSNVVPPAREKQPKRPISRLVFQPTAKTSLNLEKTLE